jgi:DNA-binding response OmpR family regulator
LPANAARLLIADDDPEMLAVYGVFFANQGFDIRTAASDAVELSRSNSLWHARAHTVSLVQK